MWREFGSHVPWMFYKLLFVVAEVSPFCECRTRRVQEGILVVGTYLHMAFEEKKGY